MIDLLYKSVLKNRIQCLTTFPVAAPLGIPQRTDWLSDGCVQGGEFFLFHALLAHSVVNSLQLSS